MTSTNLNLAHGYEKPSPIQEKVLLPILKGKDVIGQSQSGTGKTASYAISTLQMIDEQIPDCQALMLVPTRELARNIECLIKSIAQFSKISVLTCIGGTNIKEGIEKLQEGAHIVVGTPGRVLDMQHRGAFRVEKLKLIVVDDADELMSLGFQEQIMGIFQAVPSDIQVEPLLMQ